MTPTNAPRLSTLDSPPSPTAAHSECGAGGERQLTISFRPSSVLLVIDASKTLDVHDTTWEYCFAGDEPLELRFSSAEPFVGFVRLLGSASLTPLTGLVGALHFSCTRPPSEDHDNQFEFVFSNDTTSSSTAHRPRERPTPPPHASGKPEGPQDIEATAAQPTLIIRTKRSCPTGLSRPTIDI